MVFSFIVLLASAGCKERYKIVGKRDLLKYINDPSHELIREEMVHGINTSVSFEPSSLLIARELTALGRKDTVTLRGLEKKYAGNYYFLLKFSKDNKEAIRQMGSFSQYSDMVQVLAFQMQQFVNLTTAAHDTIPISDYAFDQTYGMSNANSLLLAFPKEKIGNADMLDVNVAECGFGTGSLKFNFRKKDLDKIPGLDYNKLD
jgi:hypothetical protein